MEQQITETTNLLCGEVTEKNNENNIQIENHFFAIENEEEEFNNNIKERREDEEAAERPQIAEVEIKAERIGQTFREVRVGQIQKVEIINKEYYEKSEVINKPKSTPFGKTEVMDQQGLLASADLKITFAIASTTRVRNNKNVSYRTSQQCLPFNFRTKIDFVVNEVEVGGQNEEEEEKEEGGAEYLSIEIPIYRGLRSIGFLPILDDIHSRGEQLIHHTIVLDAFDEQFKFNTSFYIRVVITNGYKDIEVASVTTNNIDVKRISEIMSNTKSLLGRMAVATKESVISLASKCSKKPQTSEVTPTAHGDVKYAPLYPSLENVEQSGSEKYVYTPQNNIPFQKADISNFATPIPLSSIPPNCQIIYCINPNPNQFSSAAPTGF